MAKQKFSLTTDLVQVEKPHQENIPSPPIMEVVNKKRVTITIALEDTLRTEMKTWCAKNNITLADALKKGFKLLVSTRSTDL